VIPPRRDPAADWELCPGARWDDFQSAQARFLAQLAEQSARYRLRRPVAGGAQVRRTGPDRPDAHPR
jgi:hypothetical protein